MNRAAILASILALSVLVAGGRYFFDRWGKITIHADNRPLGEVIRVIEKGGHVRVSTDLDPAKPVTLHLDKVSAPEAIDRLAAVAEARWRLCYAIAPTKTAIDEALARWEKRDPLADWLWIDHPMPFGMIAESEVGDPREEPWPENLPEGKPLAETLDAAARMSEVSFAIPSGWEGAAPARRVKGTVGKAVPKLAAAAKGVSREVFLLRGRPDGEREMAEGERGEGRGPRGFGGFLGQPPSRGADGERPPFDPAAMAPIIQAQIDKLPPDQKAAAQAQFDRFRQAWEEVKDLPEEERREKMREKMREMFQDPGFQSQMEASHAARDARRTPEQRRDRYRRSLERKAKAKGESQNAN